jgi:hypothetical protein
MLPNLNTLTIFTDNSNTVDIFNTLSASPPFNPILKSAVDILLAHNIDLWVLHIAGEKNSVADAISHQNFISAKKQIPGLSINPFQAPRDALGSLKK